MSPVNGLFEGVFSVDARAIVMSLSFGVGKSIAVCNQDSIQRPSIPVPTTVYSLPDEILVLVFLLSSHNSEPTPISQETLLSITHVCSRWRKLALSSGELWTSLVISFPITTEELVRAKTWLSRSNPYPLRIAIDLRDPDWDFDEDSHATQWFEMQATMGVILPEVERWQEMKIFADNWAPLHAFLYYTQNMSTPLLRSLTLRRCNPYFSAPHQTFAPSSSRAFLPLFGNRKLQELRILELEGVHVDWARSMAIRGLTKLSFGYHAKDVLPSLAEFRDLLISCPELDSLVIAGWGPRLGEDLNIRANELKRFYGTIQLPRLKALELGVMIPSYAVNLLSLFTIPSLKLLTLDDITRYDPQTFTSPDFGPIFDFLSGQALSPAPLSISTQSLSALTVMNLNPGEVSFRRFLLGLQGLRVLIIQNCDMSALNALVPSSTGTLCRNLEKLSVEACGPDLLVEVISARRTHQVSPMEVTFQEDARSTIHPLSPETKQNFTRLGIKVIPLPQDRCLSWKRFEVDDSEDFVAAILDEGQDIPQGATME